MHVRVTNAHDLLRAARGEIRPEARRRFAAWAETDRGVAALVLPEAAFVALGLADLGRRRVLYADGRWAEIRATGSVLLEVGGRRLLCDGLVEPGRRTPRVGGGALEALGLAPDPVAAAVAVALAPPLCSRSSGARPVRPRHNDLLTGWLARHWPWGPRPGLPMEPLRDPRAIAAASRGLATRRRPMQNAAQNQGQTTPTLDQTIARVEDLYRALTGLEPPPDSPQTASGPSIPPERDPLQLVDEQIDRLHAALAAPPRAALQPPLSIWESETELRFCLELPGVAREGVTLGFAPGELCVTATTTIADTRFRLCARERPAGEFRRTLALPPGIAERDVNAQMRDGVLEIRIARHATSTDARPIPIA